MLEALARESEIPRASPTWPNGGGDLDTRGRRDHRRNGADMSQFPTAGHLAVGVAGVPDTMCPTPCARQQGAHVPGDMGTDL